MAYTYPVNKTLSPVENKQTEKSEFRIFKNKSLLISKLFSTIYIRVGINGMCLKEKMPSFAIALTG